MKFSIRDALLAMAIVGLSLGWWIDRTRVAAERQIAAKDARILAIFYAHRGKHIPTSSQPSERAALLQLERLIKKYYPDEPESMRRNLPPE